MIEDDVKPSAEQIANAKNMNLDQFLQDWKDGKPVVGVSMGGLGSGYENHIWLMAVDMIDAIKNDEIDWPSLEGNSDEAKKKWFAIIDKMEANVSNGALEQASGAQVGAATNIAAVLVRNGYSRALEMAGDDRLVLVQKG